VRVEETLAQYFTFQSIFSFPFSSPPLVSLSPFLRSASLAISSTGDKTIVIAFSCAQQVGGTLSLWHRDVYSRGTAHGYNYYDNLLASIFNGIKYEQFKTVHY
jgi:hypothetical protein